MHDLRNDRAERLMTPLPADLPLAMDERMLVAPGTGVAHYARALRAAQMRIAAAPLLLGAAPGPERPRWRRALAALGPWPRRARADGEGRLVAHDLFRLAQVFFDVHGRLLTVRVPGPPGILHWSYPVPLRVANWRNLYTVHDVIPLTDPELTPIRAERHRRLLDAIGRAAAGIVTVSEHARGAILAETGWAADFVTDCSQPVAVDGVAVAPPAGLPAGGYFAVCGSVEPRKNVARLIAAHRASGTALPLVLAGPDGWRAADALAGLEGGPNVVRLPYLDRADLLALIAGARALLMPSLAEGFGLPVAEAMALGTPVLASAGTALAETAGDAALLADPRSVPALADAIARLDRDAALGAALAAAGRQRAARFTPGIFAERLVALYARPIAAAGARS